VRTAGILGTGLIGASIGQGLAAAGWTVIGWDPDAEALGIAEEVGALSLRSADVDELLAALPDVIVLSGPPEAVIAAAADLETDGLVMDVTGVKQPVLEAARPARFVGTHPMAGRERSGPRAASPALFRGAAWVVVTDGASSDDLRAVEAIVETLGARPVRMTAREHDRAVSVVSHLPQVLAAVLMTEAAERTDAVDLAAGSFRDLTRVAASDPGVWTQLLLANKGPLLGALNDLGRRLDDLAESLESGDAIAIAEMLERARTARRGLEPPVVAVRVALADQPGELARVGRALESSAVDVRDLQLRHAPFGGGGVLTLSVRPGEAETLRAAVVAEGLLLAD
jgi:prephenate dehydrogenase